MIYLRKYKYVSVKWVKYDANNFIIFQGSAGSGAASESGASVNESIVGEQTISGRSSAYEADSGNAGPSTGSKLENIPSQETEWEATNAKLHSLRLSLLNHLVTYLPGLQEIGGPRSIPFMQVILMLTTDLDGNEEKDCAAFDRLLNCLINELCINQGNLTMRYLHKLGA